MASAPVVIKVSSGAQLNALIKTLKGGETVLLAPGDYGAINVISRVMAQTVTIKSADSSHDAMFTDLRIANSAGFRFEDIDIQHVLRAGEKDFTTAVNITGSRRIDLVGLDFSGSMDGNSWNDGVGLRLTNVKDSSLVDATFTQLNNSAIFSGVTGLTVAGNTVTDVREGFDFVDVHNVTIAQNRFSGFSPNLKAGDHSDSIQFWTSGVLKGSSDVVIRDNIILQGANGGTQGIYIGNNIAGVRHSNFTIENNLYNGDARHGITVSGVDTALVKGNTLTSAPGGMLETAINIYSSSNVTVDHNITPLLLQQGSTPGLVLRDNVDVWDTATRKGITLDQLFSTPVKGAADGALFAAKAGGAAAVLQAGFQGVAGIGAEQFDLANAATYGSIHAMLMHIA